MSVPSAPKPNQSSKGGPKDAGTIGGMKTEQKPKKPNLNAESAWKK